MKYQYKDLANFRKLLEELRIIVKKMKEKKHEFQGLCDYLLKEVEEGLLFFQNMKALSTTVRVMPANKVKDRMEKIHLALLNLRVILIHFKYLELPQRHNDVLVCS